MRSRLNRGLRRLTKWPARRAPRRSTARRNSRRRSRDPGRYRLQRVLGPFASGKTSERGVLGADSAISRSMPPGSLRGAEHRFTQSVIRNSN